MEELIKMFSQIDVLIIVFCRIVGVIAFLPIVTESKLPRVAIAGFTLWISIAIYLNIDMSYLSYKESLLGFSILVVKEILIGVTIGFAVKIFFSIYGFIGSLFSMQGGLSMSTVMDGTNSTQSPTIGVFYQLGFATIFTISGGYHWLIKAIADSFELIPIGQAIYGSSAIWTIVDAVGSYFEIALRLAFPILGCMVLIDVGLGILARTVPQMNMFVIGIPLKMLILFFLMIVTIGLTSEFNSIIIENIVNTVMTLIQGMRPL